MFNEKGITHCGAPYQILESAFTIKPGCFADKLCFPEVVTENFFCKPWEQQCRPLEGPVEFPIKIYTVM